MHPIVNPPLNLSFLNSKEQDDYLNKDCLVSKLVG